MKDYLHHKHFAETTAGLHKKTFDRLFKNKSQDLIASYVTHFLDANLSDFFNPRVLNDLQKAQKQGDLVALLSSSPDFLVEAIAKRLDISLWKATTYEINKKKNYVSVKNVFEGKDKASWTKKFAKQRHLALTSVTAYSDSYLDLPLLKIVGKVIAVQPDKKLKSLSIKKGWKILK